MATTENEALTTRRDIFVFGSNLAGRHGAGAAKFARESFGAEYGVGVGRTGDSYAIPTKDGRNGADLTQRSQTLSLALITKYVDEFKDYARNHPELHFLVTRVGCGRAGYLDSDIAPLFKECPSNCTLTVEWIVYIKESAKDAREE